MLARARSVLRGVDTNFFWDPNSSDTLPCELQRWAGSRPNDPFLSFEGRRWTIGSFDAEVNRHARAWRALGVEAGQVVALVLENRPAFLFHFYALGKLGVVASLINPSLQGPALHHALHACEPTAVLVGDEQLPSVLELADLPVADERVFIDFEGEPVGVDGRWSCWNQRVVGVSPLPIPDAGLHRLSEVAAYIYTSGTTGLPKPAVVKHHRLRRSCDVFGGVARLTGEDCIYVTLPLYHASGTAIGVPAAIGYRCRLVLSRRFSASRFWRDCRDNQVSVCLYIGELCR
ncbi:MAG: AMP-binding protein, partial [Myxococcales bacterium]|nr:AMP-binding protein [Myxococcales bacterium]